jgi:alkaline phosphatase/alkaline phosphatase D
MPQSMLAWFTLIWLGGVCHCPAQRYLAQGCFSGEVTDTSVLLQTRLTRTAGLDGTGDIPGGDGFVRFQWSPKEDFGGAVGTEWKPALPESDFIVRFKLTGLRPGQRYFYRAQYGQPIEAAESGPICSFKTLPGRSSESVSWFVMTSCMNYNKFMYGNRGNAGPVITATEEDKRLGFPAFSAITKLKPDFLIGSGDIVYYDNKLNNAQRLNELRQCWHEQFRFPRLIETFADVPGYWSKDDHDFRYNDSDNGSARLPLPRTGIDVFREQLPIHESGDAASPTYRTHRINKWLQIWLTEGRDYRSDNDADDGPGKTLWGDAQFAWLKRTLRSSDAKWKIIVSPTPLVGPDLAKKSDNHTSLGGFRHEADSFFRWLDEHELNDLIVFCGDRHWQYFSVHPSGVREFACGALNDENSRMGVRPGDPRGTDPQALIDQPYTYGAPTGGFLSVRAGASLTVEHRDDHGKILNEVTFNGGPLRAAGSANGRVYRIRPETPGELRDLFRFTGKPLPIVSAHRGGAGPGYPENCIETFEHTLTRTFAMLEVDPRMTKDGQVVLHHDATLERTTTGSGRLADKTLGELKQLRLKDSLGRVTEYQIPTLDEALRWAKGKTVLVLDQKDVPLSKRVGKISEHHAEAYAMLIVGKFDDARRCYRMNPDIMMEVMIPNHAKVRAFSETGIPWENIVAFLGHVPPTDRSLYDAVHRHAASTMIGTSRNLDLGYPQRVVNDRERLRRDYQAVSDRGADIIETDLPRELGELLYGGASRLETGKRALAAE